MEFMSRGVRNNSTGTQVSGESPTSPNNKGKKKFVKFGDAKVLMMILLVSVAILIAAVTLFVATEDSPSTVEAAQVDTSKYQAVFLANGQVYFGKITALNNDVIVLQDIFYIEAQNQASGTQQSSNSNYTLRKLGTSELHSPDDKMIVNRAQVTFWENLKDSGKVVTAINDYKKNPDSANQVESQQNSSNTQPSPTTQNSQNQKKTTGN